MRHSEIFMQPESDADVRDPEAAQEQTRSFEDLMQFQELNIFQPCRSMFVQDQSSLWMVLIRF